MPYHALDVRGIRTYHLGTRANLVKAGDMVAPDAPPPPYSSPDLADVATRIVAARCSGRPVIVMMGAHVIKCGLSRLLIDLMERGVITHLATNGAGSIHDFELALIGETSEDVPHSIEDGSFGMAEETGRLMNEAVQAGARGVVFGRNVIQAKDPARFLQGLKAVVKAGLSPQMDGPVIKDQLPAPLG